MQRLIDAEGFQLGVDGLREAGLGEAHGFRAFHGKEAFKVRRRKKLHDGVVGEIFQHFFTARFGDVFGNQNEMEFALVGAQGVAAHQQPARFDDERK